MHTERGEGELLFAGIVVGALALAYCLISPFVEVFTQYGDQLLQALMP